MHDRSRLVPNDRTELNYEPNGQQTLNYNIIVIINITDGRALRRSTDFFLTAIRCRHHERKRIGMCAGDRVRRHGNSRAAPTTRANKSCHVAGSAPFLADMVWRSHSFNDATNMKTVDIDKANCACRPAVSMHSSNFDAQAATSSGAAWGSAKPTTRGRQKNRCAMPPKRGTLWTS